MMVFAEPDDYTYFDVSFNITAPLNFSFKNFFCLDKKLSENKNLEIEFYRGMNELVALGLNITFEGQDHAGPRFSLAILGHTLDVKIYDGRHWDYEKNCWETSDVKVS